MRYKIVSLLLLSSLFCGQVFAQWYQSKFTIGSYADPRISKDNNHVKDSVSFTLAKNACINLLSGPQFYNGSQDFSLMDKTLAMAAKYDMHVMVIDSRLKVTDNNFSSDSAQKIISHFKSLDADKRKAMAGYYFSGEFPQKFSGQVKKWAGYFKSNDPDKVAYVYLLPAYAFPNHAAYESYLDSYMTDNHKNNLQEIVSYDYYPFISTAILKNYFYNIAIIKEKAGTRPVWYYIQSTCKSPQPDITDYQMKFMAFCPLAYGSKGALYYTYESIPENYNLHYYDALINPYGLPTKKYYLARSINLYLSRIAGPVIMGNKLVGTYHVSPNPTGEDISSRYLLNSGNKYVKKVDNDNVLMGVFKNSTSSKYYLMLINKSSDDINNLTVTLPGSRKVTGYPTSYKYGGSLDKTDVATTNKGGKSTSFSIDKLQGGEMTVLEIK